MIQIMTLVVGEFGANCYILSFKGAGEAVVIDPGGDGPRILSELNNSNLSARYIINTHGHIDHTAANSLLSKATGAPILIHKDDAQYLEDPVLSLRQFLGQRIDLSSPDGLVEDRQVIQLTGLKLEVIHTPGHTPGSITLALSELKRDDPYCLFTGDTLFKGGVGRTDLPGGSYPKLIDSITKRLFLFADETIIYPGHGPASSIGEERRNNPFLVNHS